MLTLILIALVFSTLHVSGEHVIVVGGGASGLTAARDLVARGIDVTILEGTNRLGGRGYTRATSGGNKIDMGCQWVMGTNSNPLYNYALVRAFEWNMPPSEMGWMFKNQDGSKIPDAEMAAIFEDFYTIQEEIKTEYVNKLTVDQPFNETILMAYNNVKSSLTSKMKTDISYLWFIYEAWYSMNYVAGLDEMGTIDGFSDEYFVGGEEGYRFVENGYGNLMLAGLPLSGSYRVRYNSVVTGVQHSSSSVTVTYTNSAGNSVTMDADAVIVTVSLGVLKSGAIAFDPAPSSNFQTSLSHRHMGAVDKFVFVFNERFWADTQYWTIKDSWLEFASPTYFDNEALLFVFVGHHHCEERKHLTNEEMALAIYNELKDNVFPNHRPFPSYKEYFAGRWSKNPLFLGGWSYSGVGTDADVDFTRIQKVSNRVQIAGEHTDRDHFGSVNGAMASGERAVQALHALFDWSYCDTFLLPGSCNVRCKWNIIRCKPRDSFGS